jgi:hypothetical protein
MSIVDIARGSQLQRLQSWSQRRLLRLRRGARSSLDRGSDLAAESLRAHLDGRLHRAVTSAVRKLRTAALPRERKPSPELPRATVPPAFVCDRALVESMLL